MSQALEGIRVIDFTHDQAGPSCTQMLAWLGADVIKIERPPLGDRARKLWNSDNPNVDSFFFLLLNSNKRGTGMHLAMAILAALVQRGRTGQGQLVEVAMQEAVLNLTRVKFTPTLATGKPLARTGTRSVTGSYADLVRCAGDGVNEYVYMMLPPDNPATFEAMVEVIGRPDLLSDDRFCTPPARARNSAALTEIIEGWARQHDKRDVMKAFAGRGIPCGSVFDTAEVLQDTHLRERGTIVDLDHPTRGKFSTIISPLRLSESPVEPRRAPLYGEHTEAVLRDLAGYSDAEIAALREKKVVTQG